MDSLKRFQYAQVFWYLVGVSFAWWIKFSISAIHSMGWNQSAIVGGLGLFQCTGINCLAAMMRWRVRDFLWAEWGMDVWRSRYWAGVKSGV